ncbi:MAG: Gfo/Idh/MocA family oxidoreductase [Elusimicrobiota bacterium]|nr:Gfo/Idh/MocA family oxidoreductase [Elusimicrobiota bacterium]
MSAKTATLGAAVVGLGVGEAHAKTLAADPRCRLVAVCDRDAARAGAVGGALGGVKNVAFEAILSDPAISLVSIASFDDDHYAQALAALKAGKHVFVEKPLCRSLPELKALAAARSAKGLHLRSNLVLRAAPLWRWLLDAVRNGELGTVYAVDGDYLYGRLEKMTDGWRKDVPDYSVMQGGGVHLVDLMLAIAGERPLSVSASSSRIAAAGTAFRYDDFHAAEWRFPSGLVGRVTANFGCVHRHQHAVRVFGTKATFIYDDQGARLHLSRDPDAAPKRIDLAAKTADKGVLLPDLVTAIAAGADPAPAARLEYDLIAACLAADAARGLDRRVALEPIE